MCKPPVNVIRSLGKTTQKPQVQAAPTAQPASKESSTQPAVVVKDLRVDNSTVNVALSAGIPGIPNAAQGLGASVPLPDIHLQNIGENKRQTITETALQVLNAIDAEVIKASAKATKEAAQKAEQYFNIA